MLRTWVLALTLDNDYVLADEKLQFPNLCGSQAGTEV